MIAIYVAMSVHLILGYVVRRLVVIIIIIIIIMIWRNGHILQSVKNMKLVLFILIIHGTSKQHKRMPQKEFYQSLKGLGVF